MADDSPKPASRGNVSRLRAAGRLAALAGLPLLVIFAIFAAGVYRGATRSYRIQSLEARWLGLESPDADRGAPPAPDPLTQPTPTPTPTAPEQPQPEQPQPVAPPDQPPPESPDPQTPPQPDPTPTTPPTTNTLPTATADPVGVELRKRFDEPRAIRVKLLVDPALVIAREDWLPYTATLFEATHLSFELLFGIDLQLQGVVIWDAAAGADTTKLLADLAQHEREGADVILGVLARPRPQDYEPTRWIDGDHGTHALVFADLAQTDRFYRNLLRALAGLLGAEPTPDPTSFMSDAVPSPGTPPTLDPENRGKVIFNKHRPFADPTPEPSENP
jgi:hypothetical protein